MREKVVVSLIVILLLSASVLASVGQTQGFSIGAFNDVMAIAHVGRAQSRNMVMVAHDQKDFDAARGITLRQQEAATLTQNASVVGSGGKEVVIQTASVEGTQDQFVRASRFGARTGDQMLSLGLETVVSHKGTVGRAMGAQSVVGSQSQMQTTPNGFSVSNQSFRAEQFTAVSGGSWSTVKVNSGVDVSLTQSHSVSGKP